MFACVCAECTCTLNSAACWAETLILCFPDTWTILLSDLNSEEQTPRGLIQPQIKWPIKSVIFFQEHIERVVVFHYLEICFFFMHMFAESFSLLANVWFRLNWFKLHLKRPWGDQAVEASFKCCQETQPPQELRWGVDLLLSSLSQDSLHVQLIS